MNSEICFAPLFRGDTNLNWFDPPCIDPIFEISAPLFLWAGCLFLSIFTIAFVFRLYLKSRPIISALDRLTREINSIEPKEQTLDGVGLDQLREIMSATPLVSDAWREFDETLLVSSDEPGGLVFNTHQAEEYFSEEAIVSGSLHMRFYSALPGILTSVGLLGTFVAILVGLHHIKIDPAAQGKLTGVEGLVSSLSGKFISSICALGWAVFFTFFEKSRANLLSRSVHRFVRSMNRRLARKSAEHILLLIQRDISEQSRAFKQFNTDLSGRVKEGLSEGMGPHFQKVAEAVEELRKHKAESLTDSLEKVIGEFRTALMGSTNTEFKSLEATLTRTSEVMASMNEQSHKSQEKMSEVIESLDNAFTKQATSGDDHLARLANTMETVINRLQESAAESSGSVTASVGTLLGQIQASFSSQSDEMNRRNEELSKVMKAMLEQLQTSLSQSTTAVSSTANGVLEKSAEWNEKTALQLGAVIHEQTKNSEAINDARAALTESLNTFRSAVSDGAATLTNMGESSRSVKDGVTSLNNAVNGLSRTQDRVSDLASLVEKNAENLKSVIGKQSEIVEKYEHVVRDLDRSLSSVLTQVTSGIENYSARVKSSLETTLGQFDNHLGNATAKLGGTVHDLSESLEDLVELASKSRVN